MSEDKIVINRIFFKGAEDLQAFFGTKEWNRILNKTRRELFGVFDLENMSYELACNIYVNMLTCFVGNSIHDLMKTARKESFKKEILLYAKERIIQALIDMPTN